MKINLNYLKGLLIIYLFNSELIESQKVVEAKSWHDSLETTKVVPTSPISTL